MEPTADLVVNHPPRRAGASSQPRSRRFGLVLALGVLALVVGGGLWYGLTAGQHLAAEPAAVAAPAPQPREFTLVAEEFDWEIMPGVTVRAWGYNRQVPGPELRVREGDQVRVTLVNRLTVGTTIHWHGLDVPPAMDGPVGLNQAAVEPGQEFVYEFTAGPVGSRWYHAHADTKYQVALGLYGPIVIEPAQPTTTYDREYTLMLNEWDLELTPDVATGKAPIGPRDAQLRGGELGTDLFLMNGRAHESIPPVRVAEGERVLIRLMNAGNLPHAIHTHGHSFKLVATDGNAVPEAAQLVKDTILIGPGERYDLEIEATRPGVWMLHCHMENHADNGMMTLIEYEGEVPTGPVADYWRGAGQQASGTAAQMGHQADHDPLAAGADQPLDGPTGQQPEQPAEPASPPPVTAPPAATAPTAPSPAASAPNQVEVALLDDRFDPKLIEVPVGTVVTFVNRGANWHSVAAYDGSFVSGRIEPGAAWSVTIDKPGEIKIICQHHALRGMAAQITAV